MAKATTTTETRFHNLSPAMLADLIGELDRKAKAATAELEAAFAFQRPCQPSQSRPKHLNPASDALALHHLFKESEP